MSTAREGPSMGRARVALDRAGPSESHRRLFELLTGRAEQVGMLSLRGSEIRRRRSKSHPTVSRRGKGELSERVSMIGNIPHFALCFSAGAPTCPTAHGRPSSSFRTHTGSSISGFTILLAQACLSSLRMARHLILHQFLRSQ